MAAYSADGLSAARRAAEFIRELESAQAPTRARGDITYEGGLAAAVSAGYASASTDTGHRAGGTDASWALDHPEKIADFGYRAIHETALAAKIVIRAFYGDAPKHSYFNSCSNGGRQALMEAQRYPADYDGIVAGAPEYEWTHLLTTSIFDAQAIAAAEDYIPASKSYSAVWAAADRLPHVGLVRPASRVTPI